MEATSETLVRVLDVTLPLTPQNQVEYFKDKSILFRVDVANSRINIKQCLMTLSNMRLKCEIKDPSYDLISEYMKSNFVTMSTNLPYICANIILAYRYQRVPYINIPSGFSLEQYAEFVVDHQDMIAKWCEVINSIPLYLYTCSKFNDKEQIEALKSNIARIEDKFDNVGVNICQILSIPDFLMQYFSLTDLDGIMSKPYFSHYFDGYIYGGDNLISSINIQSGQNMFAQISLSLLSAIHSITDTASTGDKSVR